MKAVWNRPESFSNMLWRRLKNMSLQRFLEMHSLNIHNVNTYTHPMLASSHIANQNHLWSSIDTHTYTLSLHDCMSFIYSCCVQTRSFYLILSGVGMRHVLNMDSYNSPPVNSPTGIWSHTTKKTQTHAYKLPAQWMCVWYSSPPHAWVCVSMFFSFIYSMYDGYATVLR